MLSNKWALFSLRRAAFFMMSLVLLTVLFAQFAAATDVISISGTKFWDLNSNGILDPSDQPLHGYTIYIDKNNNSLLDQDDSVNMTDKNGKYSFINISASGIVREQVSSGDRDQFQPSFQREGYNLTKVTASNRNNLNFGDSMQKAAESEPINHLHILMGLVAFAVILGGGIVLIKGLLGLNSPSNGDTKEERKTAKSPANKYTKEDKKTIIQIVSGLILLLLGLYLLISLVQMLSNASNGATIEMSSPYALVAPVVLALLLFGATLLMLYTHFSLKGSEPGEMRKTIAGLLVLGLVAVVFFALNGTIQQGGNQEIITQYIQLVGIVVAFYFGSKASSDAYKMPEESGTAQDDLDIENVTYDPNDNESEIQIKVSNRKGLDFQLDRVVIKDGVNTLLDKAVTRFGSEAFKDLSVPLKLDESEKKKLEETLDSNKEYDITIKTKSIGDNSCKRKIERIEDDKGDVGSAGGSNVEVPKVEAPKVEVPKVEVPKVEVPKVEAPKVEAPKVEAPKGGAIENTIDPKIVRKGLELISVLLNSYIADQSTAKFAAEKVKADTAFSEATTEKDKAETAFSEAVAKKDKADTAFSAASAEKVKAENAIANAEDENALSKATAEKVRADTAFSEAAAEKDKAETAFSEAVAKKDKADTAFSVASAEKVKAENGLAKAAAQKIEANKAFANGISEIVAPDKAETKTEGDEATG